MAINWVQAKRGSSEKAVIRVGMEIIVNCATIPTRFGPEPPWQVSIFGAVLKGRWESKEKAKAVAETVAFKWLTEALEVFKGE